MPSFLPPSPFAGSSCYCHSHWHSHWHFDCCCCPLLLLFLLFLVKYVLGFNCPCCCCCCRCCWCWCCLCDSSRCCLSFRTSVGQLPAAIGKAATRGQNQLEINFMLWLPVVSHVLWPWIRHICVVTSAALLSCFPVFLLSCCPVVLLPSWPPWLCPFPH